MNVQWEKNRTGKSKEVNKMIHVQKIMIANWALVAYDLKILDNLHLSLAFQEVVLKLNGPMESLT